MIQALKSPSLHELAETLGRLERLDWMRSIDVTEEPDADGELSVWIWIVVDTKKMPPQKLAQPELAKLRKRIRRLLAEQTPGLWTYIRIREDENDS